MNILAVGDVVSDSGLRFLEKKLRGLQRLTGADFTVVNGENAAGTGITPRQAEAILDAGADVITLGNHAFRRREIGDFLEDCEYILRPLNYAPQVPGRGWGLYDTAAGPILAVNLIGRCGMDFGPDNPFHAIDRLLKQEKAPIVLVDFHAEEPLFPRLVRAARVLSSRYGVTASAMHPGTARTLTPQPLRRADRLREASFAAPV